MGATEDVRRRRAVEFKIWADQVGDQELRKKQKAGLQFRIVDEHFVCDVLDAFTVEEGYSSADGHQFVPLGRYRVEIIAGVPMLFPVR